MARIRKATGLGDWFDQRLATNKFWKVMVAERFNANVLL